MSIRSMTGFGVGEARRDACQMRVECRSVNHRVLEARVFTPTQCRWLEPLAIKMLKSKLARGRVDVRVEIVFDELADSLKFIDKARFSAVCRELNGLAAEHGYSVTMSDVLAFREVFESSSTLPEIEENDPLLCQALEQAIDHLVESRRTEGAGIHEDLTGHLNDIDQNLGRIRELGPCELEALRDRLFERVREAAEVLGGTVLDEQRLAQELLHYADKSDIAEELQRASSHVTKLRELLAFTRPDSPEPAKPRGKEADFYLQELIRETNTMGSKSCSAALTDLVIAMKSSIEKMREQAANVE